MATFSIGKAEFSFERKETLREAITNMFSRTCSPPPAGTRTQYVYSTDLHPHWLLSHFQPHETTAVLVASGLAGLDNLLARVETEIPNYVPLTKFRESNIPDKWLEKSACYDTTIGVQVEYDVYEITAKAREVISIGNLQYPVGDTLGVFRMARPVGYFFTRIFKWNPDCCNMDERVREMEVSVRFPGYAEIKKEMNGFRIGIELDWSKEYRWNELLKIPYRLPDEEEKKDGR